MAELALRVAAAAGVLSLGVLTAVAGAAPVLAQPSDSDNSTQSTDSPDPGDNDPDTPDDTIGDAGDPPKSTEPEPEIPVDDEDDEPAGGGGSGTRNAPPPDPLPPPPEPAKPQYENSLTVPFFRLPAPGEVPPGSWPSISSFYTTVDIPLPTLGEFLAALRVVPAPPPPGPEMRIQQEGPVLDAGTGTPGGAVAGGDGSSGGGGATVFRAPLVVSVPRAMTVAGAAPRARAVRPGQPAEQATTAPGVAGARTPVIRGSVAPTPGTAVVMSPAPASGQMPRPAGYPRLLTSPTLAQIAAVALPGLAGLLLVTLGGSVIGYRQANSLRYVRTAGAERFLP
ncbi:hypothetical protein [Mycobacterium sp. SMC-4]|uniref:hypothetical protein n=1 Tax=Mycobacterium sp. SMC-4 TaxID=2857059 RepID=UPI003CFCDD17